MPPKTSKGSKKPTDYDIEGVAVDVPVTSSPVTQTIYEDEEDDVITQQSQEEEEEEEEEGDEDEEGLELCDLTDGFDIMEQLQTFFVTEDGEAVSDVLASIRNTLQQQNKVLFKIALLLEKRK
jgi:hypothetical protein